MAAQSVHEASREGWDSLFPRVCLPSIYPSFPSPTRIVLSNTSAQTTDSNDILP